MVGINVGEDCMKFTNYNRSLQDFGFMLVKFYTICSDVGSKEQWNNPWCKDSFGKLVPSTAVLCCWVDNLSRCPISFRKHYQIVSNYCFPPKSVSWNWCPCGVFFQNCYNFPSFGVIQIEVFHQVDETKPHGTKVRDQQKYVKKHGSAKVLSRSEVSSIFDQLHSALAWIRPNVEAKLLKQSCKVECGSWKYIFDIWDETIFYWKGFSSFWKNKFLQISEYKPFLSLICYSSSVSGLPVSGPRLGFCHRG